MTPCDFAECSKYLRTWKAPFELYFQNVCNSFVYDIYLSLLTEWKKKQYALQSYVIGEKNSYSHFVKFP